MFIAHFEIGNDMSYDANRIYAYGWRSLLDAANDVIDRYHLPLDIEKDGDYSINVNCDGDFTVFRYHWTHLLNEQYIEHLLEYLFNYGFEVQYSTSAGISGTMDNTQWSNRNMSDRDW